VKLAKEYGDDLQVILVEVQGATAEDAERFAWGKGWMGGPAIWTTERPMSSGINGIPHYVLLGNDGTVLSKGYSVADKSKVEDLIEEQVKDAGDAPEDAPKSLRKAYEAFAEGDYEKAIATCEKAIEKGDDANAAQNLIDDFVLRMERRMQFIGRMLDDGFAIEAQARFETFEDGAEDVPRVADSLATLRERFESDGFEAELEAQEALEKALKGAYEDGIDEKTAKKLRKVAEDHAGTVNAGRAEHLATMVTE